MRKTILIFELTLVLVLCIKCGSTKPAYSNKENLYKKNNQELSASFLAYHINDSVSQLFFKLPNENLVYKRPDTSSYFYAACKIKYFVFTGSGSKQLLDSGSTTVFDKQGSDVIAKSITGNLYMEVKFGKTYNTEIHVYDLNKKSKSAYVLTLDKTTYNSRQNFLLQKNNGQIIFDYHLHAGDTVVIKTFMNQHPNLVADYFYREFPLSPPPFSTTERSAFNYKPDSVFTVTKQLGIFKLVMPSKGFYHLSADPDTKTGLTLYSVDLSFPGLKNETEMIKSTRYIMSKKEFDAAIGAVNKKQAIDDFWLDIGGSNERARELIRKYYGRVLEANKLFTSHQIGWQTDRGMIYIIFGAPSNMFKFSGGETWVYGSDAQPNALRFNFKKVINPFSDNDFILERSEFYKEAWYNAVESWRQGHIYLDN